MNGVGYCEVIVSPGCTLAESPVWDSCNRRVLWVDILQGNIHEWSVETNKHTIFPFGVKIGAIALDAEGGIIAATKSGFARLRLEDRVVDYVADPERCLPDNRFNDGKCDVTGRFWAGTMDEMTGIPGAGKLYALELDGSVTLKISDVSCSNGLGWNLANDTFYFIDTPTREVVAYDFVANDGNITNRRTVIEVPEEDGFPDGMAVDTQGMLWIACWGGGKVACWNPNTSRKLGEIRLPVSLVTSCAFGGENLSDLFVTTARLGLTPDELKEQPLAGALFRISGIGIE
ncbi:SMP-30/gluconolactonase/LRE family protein [Parapedobacter sp. 2B3]|uniref:SMP-30/gluconolactonase/LRE family protein n=1 Tax=Parapedobacter sp. 2B3 TaxID=3342381 RepID=UPI0035B62EA1